MIHRIILMTIGLLPVIANDHPEHAPTSFETYYQQYQKGSANLLKVKTGSFLQSREQDKQTFYYRVTVPQDYQPETAYPLLVFLHSGVNRKAWEPDEYWWPKHAVQTGNYIAIYPAAWENAMWWHENQVNNLKGIIDDLKGQYHINTNKIFLIGVHDGGAGVFFQAFKAPTPWTAFVSIFATPALLNNSRLNVDGEMYVPNLKLKPIYMLQGEIDNHFAHHQANAYATLFREAGVEIYASSQINKHQLNSWHPQLVTQIEQIIENHTRNPYPNELHWHGETATRYNRLHWLLINELKEKTKNKGKDYQALEMTQNNIEQAFVRSKPWAQITLKKRDNLVKIKSRGVKRFTLLFSPEHFNFNKEVHIRCNGKTTFKGMLKKSTACLQMWAEKDADPKMLFASSLQIRLD